MPVKVWTIPRVAVGGVDVGPNVGTADGVVVRNDIVGRGKGVAVGGKGVLVGGADVADGERAQRKPTLLLPVAGSDPRRRVERTLS